MSEVNIHVYVMNAYPKLEAERDWTQLAVYAIEHMTRQIPAGQEPPNLTILYTNQTTPRVAEMSTLAAAGFMVQATNILASGAHFYAFMLAADMFVRLLYRMTNGTLVFAVWHRVDGLRVIGRPKERGALVELPRELANEVIPGAPEPRRATTGDLN